MTVAALANAESEGLDCLIMPGKVVEIGSPTTGLLSKLPVGRGEFVQEGQVIAALNSGVEETSLALAQERVKNTTEIDQTEARLKYLSRQELRLRELFEKKTVSRESLEKAEMERVLAEHELRKAKVNFKLAELDLARAEELLKRRTILSPVSGVIMEQALRVGEYANETSYVMKVAQINPLHVEVYVPLELYQTVRVGSSATVDLKQPLTGHFLAEIEVVDYVMDPASSTFGVRLRLDNPDHTIPTGVKCQLNFNDKQKQLVQQNQ